MVNETMIKGLINGMQLCGATFIKQEAGKIFFIVDEEFTQEKLQRAAKVFKATAELQLMVKKIKKNA